MLSPPIESAAPLMILASHKEISKSAKRPVADSKPKLKRNPIVASPPLLPKTLKKQQTVQRLPIAATKLDEFKIELAPHHSTQAQSLRRLANKLTSPPNTNKRFLKQPKVKYLPPPLLKHISRPELASDEQVFVPSASEISLMDIGELTRQMKNFKAFS